MSLRKFLLQFAVAYVILLAVIGLVLEQFTIKSGAGMNSATLVTAILWSCLRFAQTNKRYFDALEKRKAVLGMLAIDIGLQTLVSATLIPWGSAVSAVGALLVGVFMVAALHAVVIWFFVGFAGKQFVKQGITKGD